MRQLQVGSGAPRADPALRRAGPGEAPLEHEERLGRILARAGVEARPAEVVAAVRAAAVVTVNFHAGRLLDDGRSVAQVLCDDGVYECGFTAPLPGDGPPASPGDDADHWRTSMRIDRAATAAGAPPTHGGLDLLDHHNGACPRFGACHLRLRPAALERATVRYGARSATASDDLLPVVADVLESAAATGRLLGRDGVGVRAFVAAMLDPARARERPLAPAMNRSLDDYVAAQIARPVDLRTDVDALVIDPAYAGTRTGMLLVAAARRHGVRTRWHPGAVLPVARIPTVAPRRDGAELAVWQAFCAHGRARRLAEEVARANGQREGESLLDAAVISSAASSAIRDPERWERWGVPSEVLTALKYLWLLVVTYGEPVRAADAD
jgi:Protein of unknown function (DUF3626)